MLTLLSPAKLNLFLKVVRRREDGYHDLESLFQTISLFDTLSFELTEKDAFVCSMPEISHYSNLAWKAVELYRKETGFNERIHLSLDKEIPLQAGLGGGSSNAATALKGMNQLAGNRLSLTDLKELALQLGSDVPFFFTSGTAYCTGRGEVMEELSPLPPLNVTLIKPLQGLSTPAVFKQLDLGGLPERNVQETLLNYRKGTFHFFNDLETPAFELMPELKTIKLTLEKDFDSVTMSGSGSTLFCVGETANKYPYPFVKTVNFL